MVYTGAATSEFAAQEGVRFHQRPEELASNTATSEDFVYEFLKTHPCDYLFQVHSVAPFLTTEQVADFTKGMFESTVLQIVSACKKED